MPKTAQQTRKLIPMADCSPLAAILGLSRRRSTKLTVDVSVGVKILHQERKLRSENVKPETNAERCSADVRYRVIGNKNAH
jgi:hypothetical protein